MGHGVRHGVPPHAAHPGSLVDAWNHGGRSWSGPNPKGGGSPPPLQTPNWLYRTMGFVGAGDFV